MDTRQLQTFIVVARLLNFRAAAEELNYSQSTVSDHIRNLEIELDVKLFERLGRKVFLSEQGKRLISSANKMIQDAEEIHQIFDKDEKVRGTLKIGAAETLCGFWLPPLLKEYSKLYPDVKIVLLMDECLKFPKMLDNNIIDVAFGLHDESKQPCISQIDLFQDSTVFVAAPDHPLTAFTKINEVDLENQAFILTEAKSGYSFELKQLLEKLNLKSNTIMEFNSLEAIKQCVKNGLGITMLPNIVVDKEIKRGELVTLPIVIGQIQIQAKMLYHNQKWMSAPLEALKNLVLQKIKIN